MLILDQIFEMAATKKNLAAANTAKAIKTAKGHKICNTILIPLFLYLNT